MKLVTTSGGRDCSKKGGEGLRTCISGDLVSGLILQLRRLSVGLLVSYRVISSEPAT